MSKQFKQLVPQEGKKQNESEGIKSISLKRLHLNRYGCVTGNEM